MPEAPIELIKGKPRASGDLVFLSDPKRIVLYSREDDGVRRPALLIVGAKTKDGFIDELRAVRDSKPTSFARYGSNWRMPYGAER